MSNAFTNFLSDLGDGLLGKGGATMKDYQHADRLYVGNNYARTPKVGFLYFINFNINPTVLSSLPNTSWIKRKHYRDVGLLVKEVDQPKFTLQTETLNQYNRKTVVQTKIIYQPVSIKFHDDNSDISNNLWKTYYHYYYMDGVYGVSKNGKLNDPQYDNTKFQPINYAYGLSNNQTTPFFDSIDIYVLHRGHGESDFTQITLVNPLITEWAHDSLNQDEGSKILTNRMTVSYESVIYDSGKLRRGNPKGWVPIYYDHTLSPIKSSIGTLGGVLTGFNDIFGGNGSLANASSPLDYLGVALQAKNLFQGTTALINSGQAAKQGYSILGGVLAGTVVSGLSTPFPNNNASGIPSNTNASTNGSTQATASTVATKGS
jgi:hypothetical protein